ncbi:MAG: DUF1449 domain-containing protein [Cyanobacteria bacterium P01_H01_bin.15]
MVFDTANLPYWLLLGVGVCLFGLVIFTGGGDDDLDGDLELDVSSDIAPPQALVEQGLGNFDDGFEFDQGGDESDLNPWQFLAWFGVGRAPLILLLGIDFSLWGLWGWFLNVLAAGAFGRIPTNLMGGGGLIMLLSFGLAISAGGMIARPLGKVFASFGEDTREDRIIGCIGTVASKRLPYLSEGRIGQVDVLDASKNLVSVPVMIPAWAAVVPVRGQEVLIIDQHKHAFFAIAKDSSDQDKWLLNREREL